MRSTVERSACRKYLQKNQKDVIMVYKHVMGIFSIREEDMKRRQFISKIAVQYITLSSAGMVYAMGEKGTGERYGVT